MLQVPDLHCVISVVLLQVPDLHCVVSVLLLQLPDLHCVISVLLLQVPDLHCVISVALLQVPDLHCVISVLFLQVRTLRIVVDGCTTGVDLSWCCLSFLFWFDLLYFPVNGKYALFFYSLAVHCAVPEQEELTPEFSTSVPIFL